MSQKLSVVVAIALFISLGGQLATAEVTFEWSTVGNPGNAGEDCNGIDGWANVTDLSCGAVSDVYMIGKHEVTNNQYMEFLNAVAKTDTNALYNPLMGSDPRGGITQSGVSGSFTYNIRMNMDNKPVNFVSFLDTMRFVNWLHNGQPIGVQDANTTEAGVYNIDLGFSEVRAAGAKFFIPTENEWYKAAYHQPFADGGDTDDYWLYPTACQPSRPPTLSETSPTLDRTWRTMPSAPSGIPKSVT